MGCLWGMAQPPALFAIPWDEEEKALIASFKKQEDMTFSINYRELLGAYFSMVLWIEAWRFEYGAEAHIKF